MLCRFSATNNEIHLKIGGDHGGKSFKVKNKNLEKWLRIYVIWLNLILDGEIAQID